MLRRKPTDEDIERLLAGAVPEDEALARLAPLTDALRSAGGRVPSTAEIDRVAVQAARIAESASKTTPTGHRAASPARNGRTFRLSPRLAAPLVVVLLLCCTTGVAFASDGAVPGDTLYSFDRAVETIGIGAGGLHERLTEADVLAGKGRVEDGLSHAAEALGDHAGTDPATQEAIAALASAANTISAAAAGEIDQIRARVAEMLRWMASTQATDAEFAQGVTARVRAIAGEPGNADTTPGSDAPGQHSGTTATTAEGTTATTQQGTTPASQQGGTGTTQQGGATGTTAGEPGHATPGTTGPQSTTTSTTVGTTPSTQHGPTGTTGGGQSQGSGQH